MMELPNHLVPWETVKQLLKGAWDEGHNASVAYGMRVEAEYPKVPRPPNNPYQEDA